MSQGKAEYKIEVHTADAVASTQALRDSFAEIKTRGLQGMSAQVAQAFRPEATIDIPVRDDLSGSWSELSRSYSLGSDSWDEVTVRLAARLSGYSVEMAATHASGTFGIGAMLLGDGLFAVSALPRVEMWARNIFVAEVTARGLKSARSTKVERFTRTELQTANDVTFNGVTYPSFEAKIAVPVYVETYVLSGALPPRWSVGQQVYAPHGGGIFPAVSANPWTALATATYHHPNGWIHEDCAEDELPGPLSLVLVKNTFRYQYDITP